jgi:hypothetical protein
MLVVKVTCCPTMNYQYFNYMVNSRFVIKFPKFDKWWMDRVARKDQRCNYNIYSRILKDHGYVLSPTF